VETGYNLAESCKEGCLKKGCFSNHDDDDEFMKTIALNKTS
jgi:hypothetical protein